MVMNIKYIGHSTFLLSIDKNKILTDPFFNNKSFGKYKRLVSSCCDVSTIPKIDTILISHEHSDNFDVEATNYLVKKYSPKVIAHRSILNNIDTTEYNKIPIDEYETKNINNISYTAYPAHHPHSFYPLSFLIKSKNNKSIFFAGDTFMTKDHDKIKPNIAILPIGGKNTMDIGSAIRTSKKMVPEYVIPMHYNTFEYIKKNPNELKYKFEKTRYNIKTKVLEPGKTFKYT